MEVAQAQGLWNPAGTYLNTASYGLPPGRAWEARLANRFRAGLGLAPSDSAVVFCDIEGASEQLERAGVRAAVRGGRLRTSWHVYNTTADVDRTLDVLSG